MKLAEMQVKRILLIAGILVVSVFGRRLTGQEKADRDTIRHFLVVNGHDPQWLKTFERLREEEKTRREEVEERRERAGHPISLDREKPIPNDFPRRVYGSELLGGHVQKLLAVARITNVFTIMRGLQSNEIEPDELASQLLGKQISFKALSDVYKKRHIAGFPEHDEYVALVSKVSEAVASESELKEVEGILKTLSDLKERNVAVIIDGIEALSAYENQVKTVKNEAYSEAETQENWKSIVDLHSFLKELDELTRHGDDLFIEEIRNVSKWFEDHRNPTEFDAASKYARAFLEKNRGKDVSLLLENPVSPFLHGVEMFNRETENMKSLQMGGPKLMSLEHNMNNLELLRDNQATSGLLGRLWKVRNLTITVRNGHYRQRDLVLGLPNGIEDVEEVLNDFMLGSIESLIGESPFVQFFLLLEPVRHLLKSLRNLDQSVDTVKEELEAYSEKWEHLIGYLEEMERIKTQLPKDSLFGFFKSYNECLQLIHPKGAITEKFDGIEKFSMAAAELIKEIGSKADDWLTLRRIGEDRVMRAFSDPDLENITKTVADTIWFIDFAKLGKLSTSINNEEFFKNRRYIKGAADKYLSNGKPDWLDSVVETKKKSGYAEALNCVNELNSIEMFPTLINSSRKVWKHGQLDDVWHAVSAYQCFLETKEDVTKMMKVRDELEEFQNKTEYPVKNVTDDSMFTKDDVRVLMDGIRSFQLLADSYTMKSQMDYWKWTLGSCFDSIRNDGERERIRHEWFQFEMEFDRFVDDLLVIEHFLYSADSDTLSDYSKLLEMASELPRRHFKLDNIVALLEKNDAFRGSEFVERLKTYGKMSEEWPRHVDSLRNAPTALLKVDQWFGLLMSSSYAFWKKEEVRYREKKGMNNWNCYCGEIFEKDDPCARYCDNSDIIRQIQTDSDAKRPSKVEHHSWWWISPLLFFSVAAIGITDLVLRSKYESEREEVYGG